MIQSLLLPAAARAAPPPALAQQETPTASNPLTVTVPLTPTNLITSTSSLTVTQVSTPTLATSGLATTTATISPTTTISLTPTTGMTLTVVPTPTMAAPPSPLAVTPTITTTVAVTAPVAAPSSGPVEPPATSALTTTAPLTATPAVSLVQPTLAVSAPLTATAPVTESAEVTVEVPIGGGEVGFGSKVKVRFPKDAADEDLVVNVRRPQFKEHEPPYFTLSQSPFEIVAWSKNGKKPVKKFKKHLEIEVSYDPAQLQGNASNLLLFYFDEKEATWIPLPTTVDQQNHRLVGQSDHLTLFDVGISNWEASRLPTLAGWQAGGSSGAAHYSFPIEVPPGPGGWQPQLALSYNSQVVDSAHNETQASWVGMGWSLDTSYVERNMRKGSNGLDDDTYLLVLNGTSYRLLPGADGKWHTQEESYLRIEYAGNPTSESDQDREWTVWDKEGNKYIFGSVDDNHRATYPYDDGHDGDADGSLDPKATWRWMLRTATNIFGQSLSYNYAYEGVAKNCGSSEASVGGNDVAVYPSQILYPNGKYRIIFERVDATETGRRLDYKADWATGGCFLRQFERSLLDYILIEHLNGSSWEQVRKYDLSYGFGTGYIFPGLDWNGATAGGFTPTLIKIEEFGTGSTALPATTFTYGDKMHLTAVDNGYKGGVEFDYLLWTYDMPSALAADWGGKQTNGSCSAYNWQPTGSTTVQCNSAPSPGLFFKTSNPSTQSQGTVWATTSAPLNYFRPGGGYKIQYVVQQWNQAPHEVRFGLDYGGGTTYEGGFRAISASGPMTVEVFMRLDPAASRLRPRFQGNAILTHVKVFDTLSRYLVQTKRIKDNVTGQTYTYNYGYDEAAVNDPIHSAVIKDVLNDAWDNYRDTDRAFTPEFSEYRGVAMTREKDQYGKVTLNWYLQDDLYRGQAVRQIVGQELYSDTFTVINNTQWLVPSTGVSVAPVDGDNAARLNNPNANWNVSFSRKIATLSDGEVLLTHFKLNSINGSNPEAVLAVENYLRWGIHVKNDRSVVVQAGSPGGFSELYQLLGTNQFKYNTWYVLMIGLGEPDLVRLWERNAVPASIETEIYQTNGLPVSNEWPFRAYVNNGDLYLDAYHELRLLSESSTQLASTPIALQAGWSLTPPGATHTLVGLSGQWVRPTAQQSLFFNNYVSFTGTRSELAYDSYGNLTQSTDKAWDGSAFTAYRQTLRGFYPTTSATRYLVGLPGFENRYACPGGVCSTNNLLGSQWFVYDSNQVFNAAPADGKLIKTRTLLCLGDSSNQCVSAGADRYLYRDEVYAYTPAGNVSSVTRYSDYGSYLFNPQTYSYASVYPQTTNYAYADSGYNTYKTSETNAVGYGSNWVYNYRLGVPTQETDANNIVTTAEYDSFGRMFKVVRPGDSSVSPTVWITYTKPGTSNSQPLVVEAAQKHSGGVLKVRKVYNGLGWLLQQQTAGAKVSSSSRDQLVDYQYNAYGQVVKQSVPYDVAVWNNSGSAYRASQQFGTATTTTYDVFGRVTEVQSPTALENATYAYGNEGVDLHNTQVCDANDNCTDTISDVWGRVVEVQPPSSDVGYNPANPRLKYGYDAADRLIWVQKWHDYTLLTMTSMNYDVSGRKVSMSDPDLGNWSYRYDAQSNLKSQTDARNCVTAMLYDNLNRLTQKSYTPNAGGTCGSGGATVTYTYDDIANGNKGKGQRTSMSDALSGTATWFYGDTRGRLTQESKVIAGSSYLTQWEYDSGDQVTKLTYPGGEAVNYTYWPQMVVNTVTGANPYVQQTLYDAANRLVLRTVGANQLSTWYNYNPWNTQGGRLKELRTGMPIDYTTANPKVQFLQYDYDPMGNVNWIKDGKASNQQQNFIYDGLDRLRTATTSVAGDNNGVYNESYTYDGAGRLLNGPLGANYTYGDASHFHAVTAVGSNSYGYDDNGNLSNRYANGNSYGLIYDAENRLTAVTGAAFATFTYDGDGARVQGTVNGVTTVYVGNYYEVSGGVVRKYYYAGNQRIAMREGTNAHLWLFNDHLGSTGYTVNSTTTTGALRYKPFGVTRYSSGTTPTSFRYTGQREEASLGIYYYNARWYDPALGRFIQPDTIVPGAGDAKAFDRYAYVFNNPLMYTDPTGHASKAIHDSNDGPAPSWTKWNDLYVTDPNRLYYEIVDWLQGHQDYNEITAMMETLGSYADAAGGAGAAYEFQNVYANAYATGQLAEVWGGEVYGGDPRFGYLAAGILTAGGLEPDTIAAVGSSPCNSFSSNTLVTIEEGSKPIVTIRVGDKVLAWNQETGEIDYYTVTATHSHLDPVLVYLTIDGETILTTPEHPFYTVAGEWVEAGDLQVGSRIYATNNRLGVVTAVQIVEKPQVMYNLTVDQAHTFAVGDGQWLVHNGEPCNITKRPSWWRKGSGPNDMMNKSPLDADGDRICPGCGRKVDYVSPDHYPTVAERRQTRQYNSRKEFLDDYYNPDELRPLCQTCNVGHGYENTPNDELPYWQRE